MYKEILRTIAGIEVFPVLSLVLFVVVFGAVLIRVAFMDRETAQALAAMPLDGGGERTGDGR
jgi:cytochrome c oxidase cbb3-type subunit 4